MAETEKLSEKYGFSSLSLEPKKPGLYRILRRRIYLAIRDIYRSSFKRFYLIRTISTFLHRKSPMLLFLAKLPQFWRVRFLRIRADIDFGNRECLLEEVRYQTKPYTVCYDSGETAEISSIEFTAAAVYAIDFGGGVVRANVDFFEKRDRALCDHQIDLRKDYLAEIRHGASYVFGRGRLVYFYSPKVMARLSGSGPVGVFNFSLSKNYAHFLMELLPRLAVFSDYAAETNMRVLIDESLHETQFEAVVALIKDGEKYALGPNFPLHVAEAVKISSSGYVPYEAVGDNPFNLRHHGFFHPVAMNLLVEKCHAYAGLNDTPTSGGRKLFLDRRAGSMRVISNADEIRELAKAHGFEIVKPEELSFKEQIRLFAEAEKIISPTGAALANCLFCRPGTEIVILCNDHPDMIFDYWPSALASRDPKITYLTGPANKHDLKIEGVHASFEINPDVFRQKALG